MSRIKVGSRVSTEAWRFDQKSAELKDRWSYLQFGELWMDARIVGTVEGKTGNRWLVKWEERRNSFLGN